MKTRTYMDFPYQHWIKIGTNNTIERLKHKIKHRTRAIGAFPDGRIACMCQTLSCGRRTQWESKRYMNMEVESPE